MRVDLAIEVERLAKRYGSGPNAVHALRDVSFSAAPGRALALLGRNGAGKSTTIAILATLLRPDAGTARMAGIDTGEDPAAVRRVLGVALQETGVPRRHTPERLLRRHAELHGMRGREADHRVAELIDAFELGGVAGRRLGTCSGGERRRLDLALALVHRPRIVLLDEPTSGLDIPARRAVWRQLRAEIDHGTTLLFTTHHLTEADENADLVTIIDDGRLVAHSSPSELKRRFGRRMLRLRFGSREEAVRAGAILDGARAVGGAALELAVADSREALRLIQLLEDHDAAAEDFSLAEPSLDAAFDGALEGRAPDVLLEAAHA